MSVARAPGVFLGTDETTGVTVANNATSLSSEIDVLGNDTSEGSFNLFLKLTSTVTAGTLDVKMSESRVTGQSYSDLSPVIGSYVPTNGSQKIKVGRIDTARYETGGVTNNATGANATNVLLGYDAYKES